MRRTDNKHDYLPSYAIASHDGPWRRIQGSKRTIDDGLAHILHRRWKLFQWIIRNRVGNKTTTTTWGEWRLRRSSTPRTHKHHICHDAAQERADIFENDFGRCRHVWGLDSTPMKGGAIVIVWVAMMFSLYYAKQEWHRSQRRRPTCSAWRESKKMRKYVSI